MKFRAFFDESGDKVVVLMDRDDFKMVERAIGLLESIGERGNSQSAERDWLKASKPEKVAPEPTKVSLPFGKKHAQGLPDTVPSYWDAPGALAAFKKLGGNITALAKEIGVHETTVWKWGRGGGMTLKSQIRLWNGLKRSCPDALRVVLD